MKGQPSVAKGTFTTDREVSRGFVGDGQKPGMRKTTLRWTNGVGLGGRGSGQPLLDREKKKKRGDSSAERRRAYFLRRGRDESLTGGRNGVFSTEGPDVPTPINTERVVFTHEDRRARTTSQRKGMTYFIGGITRAYPPRRWKLEQKKQTCLVTRKKLLTLGGEQIRLCVN